MVQLPPSSLLNKNKGKVSFNIKPLILCMPLLAVSAIHDANALSLDIRQHWVRDYLDFGQNKGIFKPGATDLVLVRKDGTKLELPKVPFVSSLNTFFHKFSRSKKMGTIRKEVPIFYLTASGRGSSL